MQCLLKFYSVDSSNYFRMLASGDQGSEGFPVGC
jgi:hypothetical protein